jgi:hypothetical protein
MTITRALSATAFLAKAATGTGSANTGSAANTSTFNFNPHLRGASYTNSHSSDNLRTLPNITEPPVKLWEVNSAHGRRLSQETCAAELTDLLISLQEKTADSAALEYTNCVNSKYNLEQNQAESVYSLLLNQFKTAGVMETIDDYRALLSNPEFVMKMADAEQGQYFDDLVNSFTTTSITTTTTGTNSSTTVSVSTTGTTNDQCVFNFNCGGVLTPAQLAKVQDTCQKLVYQNLSNDELNKQACAAVATITETTTTVTVTTATATGTNSSTTVLVAVPTPDRCLNFEFNCGGDLTPEQLAEVQDMCQALAQKQNLSNDELNKQACAAVATITETTTTVTVTQQDATTPISQTKDASLAILPKEDAALSNTPYIVGGTVSGVLFFLVAVAVVGYRCSRRRSPVASERSEKASPEASESPLQPAASSEARAEMSLLRKASPEASESPLQPAASSEARAEGASPEKASPEASESAARAAGAAVEPLSSPLSGSGAEPSLIGKTAAAREAAGESGAEAAGAAELPPQPGSLGSVVTKYLV